MKNISIKIDNVSKVYNLNEVGTGMLFQDIKRTVAKIRNKPDPYLSLAELNLRNKKSLSGLVKAIDNLSLEVEKGEVLGIIGANGAGKSTLLKLLSKITAPSSGKITYYGKLASLLEVGTGMHSEMTARENIFLNGSILGMSRKEIKKKFDEIVNFANISKYVDTPIKRFSSGMSVRLGFAVAVFLDPEILIVDEVLAVGDASFQKKAIDKMKELTLSGKRTILFVSHNMDNIKKLCKRAVLMENGSITFSGPPKNVISRYLKGNEEATNIKIENRKDRNGDGEIILSDLVFFEGDKQTDSLETGKKVTVRLFYKVMGSRQQFTNCRVSVVFLLEDKTMILLSTEQIIKEDLNISCDGHIDFIIEKFPLTKSSYFVETQIESELTLKDNLVARKIEVFDGSFYENTIDYPAGWGGKTILIPYKIKHNERLGHN